MTDTFRLPPVTEIVVSNPPGQVLAAELRGGRVWGLHWHWEDAPSPVGAIHVIRVTRLAPQAKGAFAVADEAGTEAFLDLSRSKQQPHEGQRLLAQVTRAAEDGKRLTLRPDVRLAGRYLVYTPARAGLSVSRQVRDKEAARALQGFLRHHRKPDEGLIVRAAAADLPDFTLSLLAELDRHRQTWAAANREPGLGLVASPPGLIESLIVDRPGSGPLTITVHSRRASAALQQAAAEWAPAEPIRVEQDSGNPFASSGAAEALADAFLPQVALPGGGCLWIEPTRACWTIDVDSGNATSGGADDTRLGLNRAAAIEIARQVRLRRIAGSIVIDFLRMKDAKAEQAVLSDLRAAFAEDHAALQFNDRFDQLGLYAFSRQRLGPDIRAMQRNGGRLLAILDGLSQLARQALAEPASRFALAISPSAGDLLPELPKALAETKRRVGENPVIVCDSKLTPAAYEVRPIHAERDR